MEKKSLTRAWPEEVEIPLKPWEDDLIQFARLITEIEEAGGFIAKNDQGERVQHVLVESMDIGAIELCELIARARVRWEKTKEKL